MPPKKRTPSQLTYDVQILDRFCDTYFNMRQWRTQVQPKQVEINLFLTKHKLNGSEYYQNLLALFSFDCWCLSYCIEKPGLDYLRLYVMDKNTKR